MKCNSDARQIICLKSNKTFLKNPACYSLDADLPMYILVDNTKDGETVIRGFAQFKLIIICLFPIIFEIYQTKLRNKIIIAYLVYKSYDTMKN